MDARQQKWYAKLKADPERYAAYLERQREQKRKYWSRPEVKARARAYKREYQARPEVREKRRVYLQEYRNRPEVRERIRAYKREYYARRKEQESWARPLNPQQPKQKRVEEQCEPLIRCLCLRLVPQSQRCSKRSECKEKCNA